MNNQELEQRIVEILNNDNFFDMMEEIFEFEKEYKASDFFKKTKMSLLDVLKTRKQLKGLDLRLLFKDLQEQINNLDMEHLEAFFDKVGSIFNQENSELMEQIKEIEKLRQ